MAIKSQYQARWEKNHTNCNHYNMANWDFFDGPEATERTYNRWCANCCTRFYRDKQYNPDEWDVYVNKTE